MGGGGLVWLEGDAVDPGHVGPRAAALARLLAAGLPVPRAFALGRDVTDAVAATVGGRAAAAHVTLPQEVVAMIDQGVRELGLPAAVRRVAFWEASEERAPPRARPRTGGRPDRESYLNLIDPAEVVEAVRRVLVAAARGRPAAAMVQRFVSGETAAVVRREPADPACLHVEACYGVGHLLAAGLVVPDRFVVRAADGHVLRRTIGRKTQRTIPPADGGLSRVPVPPVIARRAALADEDVARLIELFRAAEAAAGPLAQLRLVVAGDQHTITTAVPR